MSENNYGTLNNYSAGSRNAPVKRSQVYLATHNGEGQTLPYMYRSFISFTYGGKKIEDFDLIATISGDRLNRSGYASFDDTVTTYDNLDGLHYWATHYKTNQMDFTLSTDGIDQRLLDNFLHWFKAGTVRELILAEHPNRAIMARVSLPPTLDLLPFEHDVEMVISNSTYKTKTTLYKGDILLSLVMDQPHWYSITNVLGKKTVVAGRLRYEDIWNDVTTGREISIFASLDALKILYEDGIPLGSMIDKNMLLGNGAYAQVENQIISCIWSKNEEDEDFSEGEGAKIDSGVGDIGIIAGAIVDATDNGISSLVSGANGYFFYAGTAPSPTIISFELLPVLDGSSYYITTPCNSHTSPQYNTFTIESLTALNLCFTTPNLFTSYNKAIEIFDTKLISTNSWEDIRKELRNNVHHKDIRAWAMRCIDYAVSKSLTISDSLTISTLKSIMSLVLKKKDSNNVDKCKFSFNSENGEAIGYFHYRIATNAIPSSVSDWNSYGAETYLSNEDTNWKEEDVGDMLKSNYIFILDRNYPTSYGNITSWENSETGKRNSHRIYHDVDTPLTKILILYKNMYL